MSPGAILALRPTILLPISHLINSSIGGPLKYFLAISLKLMSFILNFSSFIYTKQLLKVAKAQGILAILKTRFFGLPAPRA